MSKVPRPVWLLALIGLVAAGLAAVGRRRRSDGGLSPVANQRLAARNLRLAKLPTFAVTTAAPSLIAVSTTATWFLYPLFMTEVWDYSILEVGLAMTPGPLTIVILAPFAGRFADRHGFRSLLVVGAAMATLGTAWLAW